MLMRTYKQCSWSKKAPWKVCLKNINLKDDDFVRHTFSILHLRGHFNKQMKLVEQRMYKKYCPNLFRMILNGIKRERF